MTDHVLDDDDVDLAPEVMCQLARRRLRIAAMAASTRSEDHRRSDS